MAIERTSDLNTIYVPLKWTYGLVPVVAGIDKFSNLLTDWGAYLPSFASDLLPVSPTLFMQIVGVIEIVAGLAVLNGLTRLGAHVVMAWLVLIAATVAMAGYYDIAVRDLVMAIGAYALGQAARLRGEQWIPAAIRMEEPEHVPSK